MLSVLVSIKAYALDRKNDNNVRQKNVKMIDGYNRIPNFNVLDLLPIRKSVTFFMLDSLSGFLSSTTSSWMMEPFSGDCTYL